MEDMVSVTVRKDSGQGLCFAARWCCMPAEMDCSPYYTPNLFKEFGKFFKQITKSSYEGKLIFCFLHFWLTMYKHKPPNVLKERFHFVNMFRDVFFVFCDLVSFFGKRTLSSTFQRELTKLKHERWGMGCFIHLLKPIMKPPRTRPKKEGRPGTIAALWTRLLCRFDLEACRLWGGSGMLWTFYLSCFGTVALSLRFGTQDVKAHGRSMALQPFQNQCGNQEHTAPNGDWILWLKIRWRAVFRYRIIYIDCDLHVKVHSSRPLMGHGTRRAKASRWSGNCSLWSKVFLSAAVTMDPQSVSRIVHLQVMSCPVLADMVTTLT